MGSYRDSFLSFQPTDPAQVFNGITSGSDYVVGRDQGIFFASALPQARRQAVLTAYPGKRPMELTQGWRQLTQGFLAHEMSHDLELRRHNWQEAQRIYASALHGDVRVVADFAAEPPDGFLRQELLPLLLLRADSVSTINRLAPAEFVKQAGWQSGANPKKARIFQLRATSPH